MKSVWGKRVHVGEGSLMVAAEIQVWGFFSFYFLLPLSSRLHSGNEKKLKEKGGEKRT
jgi:hypothetical protein